MKQTQFDRGQVLKGSFSELQSALRVFDTNPVLKDAYTHMVLTSDAEGRPLTVEYYQAKDTAIDEIFFVGDVSQSLAGKYFVLQEFLTKETQAFYYVVDGNGTAPGVADTETPIAIMEDDPANLVCYATQVVIKSIPEYLVTAKSVLGNYLTLEYNQFGETSAINVGTSGFGVVRVQEGESFPVGEIEIAYDAEGNPIYNGITMTGLVYNPYKATFEGAVGQRNSSPISKVIYDVKDVTTSVSLLAVGIANQEGRRSITIQPKGKTIWYGYDNTVTSGNSGNGFKLTSNSFATIELSEDQEIYAVTSSGIAKVTVAEMK